MVTIKRLVSLILTLAVSLTSVTMAAYAEDINTEVGNAEEVTEAVADERFETAVAVFVSLKVFEKAPVFTDTLTREEFARIIHKAMRLPVSAEAKNGAFADVPGKYKESPYIASAMDAGIFIGRPGDLFRPREALTEDEAVIALVNAAGYREKIKLLGDEMSTYLTEAKSIGITKDITINPGEKITYEKLIIMMYNAFSADMLVIKEFKGNEAVYGVGEDVTLFSELYDVYEDDGIVTANEYTYLDRARFGKANTIVINSDEGEAEYDGTLSGGGELLGMRVNYTYLIDEETDTRMLLSIEADEKNDILTLSSYDIESTEPGKVWYEISGGRRKDAKIPDDADIIYNGVAFAYADENTFFPDYGKLTFIDNNSDDRYDVVLVEDYISITVWGVDSNNLTIYPDMALKGLSEPVRVGGKKIPDLIKAEDSGLLLVEKDGKKASLSRVKKGDAVTVMMSDVRSGSVLVKLIASSKKVTGEVTAFEIRDDKPYSVTDDDGNQTDMYGLDTIAIDGETYNVAGDVMMLLDFGFAGDFLLDAFGNIAGWAGNAEMKAMYSYLINIGYNEEENELILRMLYENGIYTNEDFKDEIKIDNVKYEFSDIESVDEIKKRFKNASAKTGVGNGGVAQPLKITFKKSGMVANVDTLLDEGDDIDKSKDSDGLKKGNGEATKSADYRSYTGIFNGLFGIDANTVVFQVRRDPSINRYNSDHFCVAKNTVFDNESDYNVVAYDMTSSGYAPLVISYHTSNILKQGGVMLVEDVKKVWSEEESTAVTRISGIYYTGSVVTVDAMPGTAVDKKLSRGDVAIVEITKDGKLNAHKLVYDNEATNTSFTNKLPGSSSGTEYTVMRRLLYGYVESNDGKFFTLNCGSGAEVFSSAGAKVYILEDNNIKPGSMNDIVGSENRSSALDKVVVYVATGRVRTIYVYKGGATE